MADNLLVAASGANVWIQTADGTRRIAKTGEVLQDSERLIVADGQEAILQNPDKLPIVVEPGEFSFADLQSRVAQTQPQASSEDEIAALQQSILQGIDPTQTFEAAAAGDAGATESDSSGGGEAVTIARSGSEVVAQSGFDTASQGVAGQAVDGGVGADNDAPVITSAPPQLTTDEDINLTITTADLISNVTDPEGDLLTVQALQLSDTAAGTLQDNGDGSWTLALTENWNGSVGLTYNVVDAAGNIVANNANVNVTPVNDAPEILTTENLTATEDGNSVTGRASFEDVDEGDSHTYSVSSLPAEQGSVSIDPISGEYTYSPNEAFQSLAQGRTANVSFDITVTDAAGLSDTQTVTVTITGTNDAPELTVTNLDAIEDGASVTGNASFEDVDIGDTHIYSVSSLPAEQGSVSINAATGEYEYSPGNNFQSLAEGETTSVNFDVTVTDNNNGSDTQTVTVTITGTNDAPELSVTNLDAIEDGTSVKGSASFEDVDISDTHIYSVSSLPAGQGSVSINSATGEYTYSPGNNFQSLAEGETRVVTFDVTVTDNHNGSDTETVSVTITGTNDGPVANNDSLTTDEDTRARNIKVLDNDTDIDGDSLSVTSASAINGSVTINPDGTLNYSPNIDFNGRDTITYSISDGNGGTDTATVDVTVSSVDDATVALNDSASTTQDTAVDINVLGNDFDIDSGVASVVGVTPGENGSVSINNSNGTVKYTPNAGFSGSDSFTYTNADGDSATVTVTVRDTLAPDAPRVTITEDIDNNGSLTNAEIDGDTNISVTLPDNVQVGDTLNLTINGTTSAISVTQVMFDTKSYQTSTTVPAEGETLNVSATVKDQANNTSSAGSDSVTRADETPTGAPTVTILESGKEGDGIITTDELNNDGRIDVQIGLPDDAVAGDTLVVIENPSTKQEKKSEIELTDEHIKNKTVTTTATNPGDGKTITVDAVLDDKAGNSSRSASDSATMDTSGNARISIDAIAGDGIISPSEAKGPTITVKGTVYGDAATGDEVTFTVNGQQYKTTVADDGETWSVEVKSSDLTTVNQATATVSGTDDDGNPFTASTTSGYKVNVAPEFEDKEYVSTYNENIDADTVIDTVKATDVNGDAVTYKITTGNDNNWFEIDAQGQITLTNTGVKAAANNFEGAPNAHTLTVVASDGSEETSVTVKLSEQNVNEAPEFSGLNADNEYDFVYNENSSGDTEIGTVTATDVEGDAVTYRITTGNDNNWFEIDAQGGQITLTDAGVKAAANNFEGAPNAHTLTVVASDGSEETSVTVKLSEQNVNDAPIAQDDTYTLFSESFENISAGKDTGWELITDKNSWDVYKSDGKGNARWETTNSGIEIQQNGLIKGTNATHGKHYAELDPDSKANAVLSKEIDTSGQDQISIEFDYKPRTSGNSSNMKFTVGDKTYTINADGSSSDSGVTITLGDNGWYHVSGKFNVHGINKTEITFAGDGTADNLGAFIDDIKVTGLNNPALITNEDTELKIHVSELLANDFDEDGDKLSISDVKAGEHCKEVKLDGEYITFTPDANYSGDASFTYTVTDGKETSQATVTLKVNPVVDPATLDVSTDDKQIQTITLDNVNNPPSGVDSITPIGVGANGKNATVSGVNGGGVNGFGVNGAASGAPEELGAEESLQVTLKESVSSIDVKFAWLASSEQASYQLLDSKGGVVGKGTVTGISDRIDPLVTLVADNGAEFTSVKFSSTEEPNDYLIHSISYETRVVDDGVSEYRVSGHSATAKLELTSPDSDDGSETVTGVSVAEVDGLTVSKGDNGVWTFETAGKGTYNTQIVGKVTESNGTFVEAVREVKVTTETTQELKLNTQYSENGVYTLSENATGLEVKVDFTDVRHTSGLFDGSYNNSFGVYFADETGKPVSGYILDTKLERSDIGEKTLSIDGKSKTIPDGAVSLGFFLVSDGGGMKQADAYKEGGALVHFEPAKNGGYNAKIDGKAVQVNDNGNGHSDSDRTEDEPILFSNPALNPSDYDHEMLSDDVYLWEDIVDEAINTSDAGDADVKVQYTLTETHTTTTVEIGETQLRYHGTADEDLLIGSDGDDLLIGGLGDDQLEGGDGADTFIWQKDDADNSADTVLDFNTSEGDVLDISELLSGVKDDQIQRYLDADLQDNGDLVLSVNTDGKEGAELTINLQNYSEINGISSSTSTDELNKLLNDHIKIHPDAQ